MKQSILLLFIIGLIATNLFGQKEKKISLLFSVHHSSSLKKYECCILNIEGQYGIGGEVRYLIKPGAPKGIKTEIGIRFQQLSLKNYADLPVGAYSIKRHHLLSIPIYWWGYLVKDLYLKYNLSLEAPLSTHSSGSGGRKHITPFDHKNIGIGTGLALGYDGFPKNKKTVFIEGFFNLHAIFLPMKGDFSRYLTSGEKPYSLGINGGIRF